MARPLRGGRGGILSLDALVEEHRIPIESDLIDRGLRLRHLCADDHDFNWVDLRAVIDCALPDSAVMRATSPDEWQWKRLENQLLALIADSQRWLVWAKTPDGQKNRNQPRRIPRPGVDDGIERIGDNPVPISEMNEFLGWTAA